MSQLEILFCFRLWAVSAGVWFTLKFKGLCSVISKGFILQCPHCVAECSICQMLVVCLCVWAGMTWAEAEAAVSVHPCVSLCDFRDDGGLVARVQSYAVDCCD